ncbi:MAG: hypothetical protein CVU97_04945 [Firmicutes bacterium HGW-Firmicutes-21]|nr:MAG: hypothetical protein CVU97_04945 [Firmicutes bacterium HGW-Firmicutes-21]
MLGAICGDIIGSVFEIHNVKSEDFELFSRESSFTDDSVLTVAVADALIFNNKPAKGYFRGLTRQREYAYRYKQYYSRYPYAGFGNMFKNWAAVNELNRQNSYANGAAMRVSPIGFAFDNIDDVIQEAVYSCKYTHNHKEAIQGAKAVAVSVFFARTGCSKEYIKKYIERYIKMDLSFTLDSIRKEYVFDSRASYSVPPAIVAFLESNSFESAIRKAISIGGDSDTIACITGGIAQAYYKTIPSYITNKCLSILDSGLKKTLYDFNKQFNISYDEINQ